MFSWLKEVFFNRTCSLCYMNDIFDGQKKGQSSGKIARNAAVVKWSHLYLIDCSKWEHTPQGTLGHFSKGDLKGSFYRSVLVICIPKGHYGIFSWIGSCQEAETV